MKQVTLALSVCFIFSAFLGCAKQETNTKALETPVQSPKSAPSEQPTPVSPANTSAAEPGGAASIYTDITASKCKTIDSNEDEAWIIQRCGGVAGYELEVFEGDLRQSINLITPEKKKIELDFSGVVSSGFSTLGEKAEWRIKQQNGKPVPYALIVRYNVGENSDDSAKPVSYLVVSKITPKASCIVEVIDPVSDANKRARDSADASADKSCKEKL